jgi:hypothetical protein
MASKTELMYIFMDLGEESLVVTLSPDNLFLFPFQAAKGRRRTRKRET